MHGIITCSNGFCSRDSNPRKWVLPAAMRRRSLGGGGGWVKSCPHEGGPIQFPNFNGELICPAYSELCDEVRSMPGECVNGCNLNGECIQGKCRCFLGYDGDDCGTRTCPDGCSNHGTCSSSGVCECEPGYTGVDCSTASCDEQCSLHGGVCDNGVCEFRCSDYAGYTCQNSSTLIPSLSLCGDVLIGDARGQHCAPSEASILQQLEAAVVMPNYNRLIPNGRSFLNMFDNGYCAAAAQRLACWISIQRCDMDGDNRLRVCHSACESYNSACGARLDCSDRTLFSGEGDGDGLCTGDGAVRPWWELHFRTLLLAGLLVTTTCFFLGAIRHLCKGCHSWRTGLDDGSGGGGFYFSLDDNISSSSNRFTGKTIVSAMRSQFITRSLWNYVTPSQQSHTPRSRTGSTTTTCSTAPSLTTTASQRLLAQRIWESS